MDVNVHGKSSKEQKIVPVVDKEQSLLPYYMLLLSDTFASIACAMSGAVSAQERSSWHQMLILTRQLGTDVKVLH
jgi:hypothetical protein